MSPNEMVPKYDPKRPGGLDMSFGEPTLEMPVRPLAITPNTAPKLPSDGRLDKKKAGQLALSEEVIF